MTNQEAKILVDNIFEEIKKSKSVSDIKNIEEKYKQDIPPKNIMNVEVYPKIEFTITNNEIDDLINRGLINKEGSLEFTKDITSKLTDPLNKLLYATLWKNGDLQKIKHIVKGILESDKVNEHQNGALVFYQFGKFLTKEKGQPIVDQHVLRAFSIYKSDSSQIDLLRKMGTIDKKHKNTIEDYKQWLISNELTEELKATQDYTYEIDKLLFAIGKTVKLKKH